MRQSIWALLPLLFASCKAPALPEGCRPEDLLGQVSGPVDETSDDDGDRKWWKKRKKEQDPAPVPPPTEISLSPESLKSRIFEGNSSLLMAMNRAHAAKDQVNLARANLLPSINLGALVFSAGSPAFVLSKVDLLLPFLLPSNWFEYFEAKELWKAQIVALRVLKLNVLASSYSLFFTLNVDTELRAILDAEVRDLEEIELSVLHAREMGLVGQEQLDLARGQLESARISARKVSDLLQQEVAAVRHALGLPTSTAISWACPGECDEESMPTSQWEAGSVEDALARAIEVDQIRYLTKAAKMDKWSQIFGFFGGASISGGQSSAFSGLNAGGSFSIGFATLPLVQLSHRNEVELQLRREELDLEMAEALEIAGSAVAGAKERAGMAREMESSFRNIYETRKMQYEMGMDNIVPLLQARSKLRQGAIEVLQAKAQLWLNRVTFHRMMVTDSFTGVDCDFQALDRALEERKP